MKIRYFLVVVSAVVCTVWSEAESQDCSNTEELIKSLRPIRVLTDEREFGFSMSREELDRVCPVLIRVLRCIDSYMTVEVRHSFYLLYHGISQLTEKLCHPGPFQEEFLIHAPCLGQVNGDFEHCVHPLQQKTGEVHVKPNDLYRRPANEMSAKNDSDLRTLCCSFRDFLVCMGSRVMERCGAETAKFAVETFEQTSSSFRQARCESYPNCSDQSQDSSASRNSPRALLLPLSLGMISLYDLRPT